MKRYFNTKEAAERHLKVRQKTTYKRIEKKGWKVVGDTSFVYKDFLWTKPYKIFGELYTSSQTKAEKWFTLLAVVSDEMIKDLLNYKPIDVEAELEAVLSETAKNIDKNIIKNTIEKSGHSHQKCDKCGGEIRRKHIYSCPTDGKYYCEKCIDPEGKIYNDNFFSINLNKKAR